MSAHIPRHGAENRLRAAPPPCVTSWQGCISQTVTTGDQHATGFVFPIKSY